MTDIVDPKPEAPLPEQYCTSCKEWRSPRDARGQCPVDGRPMLGSVLAQRRKVNKARVAQLEAEIVAEYSPDTLELKDACRFLAAIKERLEAERLGSPEHQRLMTQWADLSTQLRAARGAEPAAGIVESLSTDELIKRLTTSLHILLRERDHEARGVPRHTDGIDGGPAPDEATAPAADPPAPSTATPTPPIPWCRYCERGPCVGPDHFAYDVLHWNDPEEVKRRDDARTREMFAMVGRPLGVPHLDARVGPRPDPLAGLSPEDREREQKARAVREALGWECGILNEQTGRYQP